MSFFSVRPGRTTTREVIDQVLHATYSGALFLVIYYAATPVTAGLLSFGLGVLRELEQKKWDWKLMGRQDLFFWGLASFILTIAYSVVELLH